jgi:hypothetical protein
LILVLCVGWIGVCLAVRHDHDTDAVSFTLGLGDATDGACLEDGGRVSATSVAIVLPVCLMSAVTPFPLSPTTVCTVT